ncbi:MAG: RluA family pseudouridine synthase [Bacteroidota bacterium]
MSQEPDKIETVTTIDVPPGQAGGVRLDVYLASKLPNTTRAKVQRGIKEGRVDVNEVTIRRPSAGVQPNDRIVCRLLKPPPIEIEPEAIPLDIVFEDETLIVLDKTPGMVVHPAFGHRTGTLIHALLYHVGAGPLAAETVEDEEDDDVGLATASAGARFDGDPTIRPGLVHRLDKDTSGLMVVAKTDAALAHLGHQFAARTIRREYVALVWGGPDPREGRVETWLARDPRNRKRMAVRPEGEGKWAATNYAVEEDLGHLAVVRFRLETGRTHQIRVHAKHLGHPVFSDRNRTTAR